MTLLLIALSSVCCTRWQWTASVLIKRNSNYICINLADGAEFGLMHQLALDVERRKFEEGGAQTVETHFLPGDEHLITNGLHFTLVVIVLNMVCCTRWH